jgi:hypothetical protein
VWPKPCAGRFSGRPRDQNGLIPNGVARRSWAVVNHLARRELDEANRLFLKKEAKTFLLMMAVGKIRRSIYQCVVPNILSNRNNNSAVSQWSPRKV